MTIRSTIFVAAAVVVALSDGASAASQREEAVQKAHETYLAAINASDLDAFLAAVTDDVVFIAPNAPVMVGKSEVAPWARGYFEAVQTSWQKETIELVVTDGWAFERYSYRSADTPRAGGAPQFDTGNGINIYRAGADGKWRVARDVWATNQPLAAAEPVAELFTCTHRAAPC